MKKKIGFYGGTFDPIHFGHLNLAIELMEAHQLDEVWFCPARLNPLKKEDHSSTPFEHRLEMVRLAVEDYAPFKVLDIEGKQQPSYTIDTLKLLLSQSQEQYQLFLMIGEDALDTFPLWHQVDELVQLVPLLIGSRTSTLRCPVQASSAVCAAIQAGITKTHLFDISATQVRERLRQGLYCGHLIPRKAIDFIQRCQLYS